MSENTVLISFNVQLSSKQIVPWTILPVDRTMTVAELWKSIFVGDFTDIKEVGENNNPFVNYDLKYEVSVGKSKSLWVNTIVLFVCQNSRIELVCIMYLKPLKIKTKYKNPSHVGLEIKTKNKNPTYLALFFLNPLSENQNIFFRWP